MIAKTFLLSFLCLKSAFAFSPSSLNNPLGRRAVPLAAQKLVEGDDVENAKFLSSPGPLLSARDARVSLPLATAAAMIFTPTLANAKASTSTGFDKALKDYFPGAIPSTTVLLRVQSILRKRQYYPYNTLIGTSISSEEIVNTPTSVINQIRSKFSETKDGGVYTLGGLGGIPFAGVSGMYDMLSHIQKDGRALIIFGPNVGISNDGTVGMVERIGRSDFGPDESNGVVVRAYKELTSKGSVSKSDGLDIEKDYIVKLLEEMPLKDYQAKEGGDNYAISKVTKNMYKITEGMIENQVKTVISQKSPKFWDGVTEVTLMGGIFINRGHGSGVEGGDDFFQPLMMKTITKGGDETDLYKDVFGDLGAY